MNFLTHLSNTEEKLFQQSKFTYGTYVCVYGIKKVLVRTYAYGIGFTFVSTGGKEVYYGMVRYLLLVYFCDWIGMY